MPGVEPGTVRWESLPEVSRLAAVHWLAVMATEKLRAGHVPATTAPVMTVADGESWSL
jgi:hypothetical protein